MEDSLIYTPNLKIPVGEAVQRQDGTYALRVKNPRTNRFDEITVDTLYGMILRKSIQKAKCRDSLVAETRIPH